MIFCWNPSCWNSCCGRTAMRRCGRGCAWCARVCGPRRRCKRCCRPVRRTSGRRWRGRFCSVPHRRTVYSKKKQKKKVPRTRTLLAVQRQALENRPRGQRQDQIWSVLLRLHAGLPDHRDPPRLNGEIRSVARFVSAGATVEDLSNTIEVLVVPTLRCGHPTAPGHRIAGQHLGAAVGTGDAAQ